MKSRDDAYQSIGAELRRMRDAAQLSLASVGEELGVERDAMSKYERGVRPIPMYDYLVLMHFYCDIAGKDHPGVKLSSRHL